ncbi:FAD-dependent monooxygenase [Candidatus Binatia bacterium]|nr:FAD-dependent monooxygenase [Candidatus Binatia bacterium]
MNALAELGLASPVVARGVVVEELVFRSWAGRELARLDVGTMSRDAGAPSIVIRRRDLLCALREQVACDTRHRVVGFDDDGTAVTVRLDDGREVRARALVACDGLDSRIRAALVADGPPREAYQRAWVGSATLDHALLEDGVTTVTHGLGARFCIASVRGRDVTWLATINESRFRVLGHGLSALRRVFDDAHEPIGAILAATPADATFETRIRYRAPVERWGRGRVTLLGDAAHPCTPDLAQGACQALEDAVVLARVLPGRADVAAALRDYESRRLPHANRVANISWIVQAQGAEDSTFFGLARDLGTGFFLRHVAAREIASLLGHRP